VKTEEIQLHLHFDATLPWDVVRVTYEDGNDFLDVHHYAAFEVKSEADEYLKALRSRLAKVVG